MWARSHLSALHSYIRGSWCLPLPFLLLPLLFRPLSLPLLLLTRVASLVTMSFPSFDLKQHMLAVAGLILQSEAATSIVSSLTLPRSSARFAAEVVLACAGAVGGLWVVQSGVSLYVDAFVPTRHVASLRLPLVIATVDSFRCSMSDSWHESTTQRISDCAFAIHCKPSHFQGRRKVGPWHPVPILCMRAVEPLETALYGIRQIRRFKIRSLCTPSLALLGTHHPSYPQFPHTLHYKPVLKDSMKTAISGKKKHCFCIAL
jgi:hypothetical protein